LLLEDDLAFAEALQQLLPAAVHRPTVVQHVTQLSKATAALQDTRFDVVLVDLNVPDSSGKATISRILPRAGGSPVIVLTSVDDEELAVEAVREGAQDFMLKAEMNRRTLGRVIHYAIERKRSVEALHEALADLKKSNDDLKHAQLQVVQSEKLEAVSTFAAGVAHEVKNPLQTIILGVDYLARHSAAGDKMATMVLEDMAEAVQRADAIIRGLIEFSAYNKKMVKEENLTEIVEQALQAVRHELANHPIRVRTELNENLPPLRLDLKTIKHVFINLLMYCVRSMPDGGSLGIRIFSRQLSEPLEFAGRKLAHFKVGETVVLTEVEYTAEHATETITRGPVAPGARTEVSGLGLTVLKKIIELYGGVIHSDERREGSNFTIVFKAAKA
jgi:signal transduction histidine kinase